MKYAIQGLALIAALINLDILKEENINNVRIHTPAIKNIIFEKNTTLQTHHMCSTLKRRGIHDVFVGRSRVRTLWGKLDVCHEASFNRY